METEYNAEALATYIVRELERMFPSRPTGRSKLQKMFYLLSRKVHGNLRFDLFLNGPYSDQVEKALGQAVESGMLSAVKENGRSNISARGGITSKVPLDIQGKADQCILAYGFYGEEDLAILTTALFLEDCDILLPDELIKAVLAVNPRFDLRRVCSLLDRSDVVFRSW